MYITTSEVILRIRERFRDRQGEWVGAGIMAGWGSIEIAFPENFNGAAFAAPIFDIGPTWWGVGMVVAAAVRFTALGINGYMSKPTAWARTISGVIGAAFFFVLSLGIMLSGSRPPGSLAVYLGMTVQCLFSVYWARQDTRIAGDHHGRANRGR